MSLLDDVQKLHQIAGITFWRNTGTDYRTVNTRSLTTAVGCMFYSPYFPDGFWMYYGDPQGDPIQVTPDLIVKLMLEYL